MSSDDCSRSEPGALTPADEALAFLLEHARVIEEKQTVNIENALGCVLAEPVKSSINVPPWNNSAMDGYAICREDINLGEPVVVSQRIPAGSTGGPLEKATAARIFTGAPIPEGTDTVIMQEHTRAAGDKVIFDQLADKGANIRHAGEDVEVGKTVLLPGIKLEPQHLGLAASVGVSRLTVYRRLKVAIFSSGDELVMPGQPLSDGQIYNSNQFTLMALLQALNCEVLNLGIVEDTFDATCQALSRAAEEADLILASGGVSVGEEDHVKPAIEKLGSLQLWKIAIRPGKPLAFGQISGVPFIGAPGNPVSLFVTFCIFARPFIRKMQGYENPGASRLMDGIANFDLHRPDKRQEYARARMYTNEQGQNLVDTYPSRSSGVLSSVTWANGLVVIEPGEMISRGDKVSFIPFNELLS